MSESLSSSDAVGVFFSLGYVPLSCLHLRNLILLFEQALRLLQLLLEVLDVSGITIAAAGHGGVAGAACSSFTLCVESAGLASRLVLERISLIPPSSWYFGQVRLVGEAVASQTVWAS